jgi:hypothetical protein
MNRIEPYPVAVALSFIFLVLYLVCVALHFLLPGSGWQMFRLWEMIMFGFTWLTTLSLFSGILQVFIVGFYTAYTLIPLYNYFNKKFTPKEGGDAMKPLRFKPVAFAVTTFGVITYILCILFDLIFPQWAMYQLWEMLLPGFTGINWSSFFIGLAGILAYGIYISVVFVPIYNYFRSGKLAEVK